MNRVVAFGCLMAMAAGTQAASACPLFLRLRPLALAPCPRAPAVKPMVYADVPATLRLKFEKGKNFFVESTIISKQKLQVMGQEIVQTQQQVFVHHWQPQNRTETGDWIVRLRTIRMIMDIEIGGNHIKYDSWNRTPASPMVDFFKAVEDAELILVVQPDGGVLEVRGREKLLQKIAAESPAITDLMKGVLSEESLKRTAAPLGAYLPRGPVTPGATWSHKDTLDIGPIGRYRTTKDYIYHAARGSEHEIRFKSSFKYTPPDDPKGLPFTIKSAELKSTGGEGKILFDADQGRLHEASHVMRLTATLLIEVGNHETRVDIEQTQTTRVRTLDTYDRRRKD